MSSLVRTANPFKRFLCGAALLAALGIAGQLATPAPQLAAQQTQRAVQGKVVDKAGTGVKGATVYLKDDHTLSVRSYIASDDGSYRFGQLAQSSDYELWAEVEGKKSAVKNLSSFDTRPVFNITLKIDK